MKKVLGATVGIGCLTVVVAPIVAAIAYPYLNWLFWVAVAAFCLVIGIVILDRFFGKDKPAEVAQLMERILDSTSGAWDVDEVLSCRFRNRQLEELRLRALKIGQPEDWWHSSDQEKATLREIIADLRKFDQPKGLPRSTRDVEQSHGL